MMFTKLGLFTTLAAFTSALPHAMPVQARGDGGGVSIRNNLEQNVYAWSVASSAGNMKTLSAGGGSYSEEWQNNSNGGGVSIKLATEPTQDDVLQFEYTEGGETIYWDMSCINLGSDSAFTKFGFSVEPSQTSENCPSVNCAAGDKTCADAYLQPKDDHATHGCPIDTTFTVQIGN